MLRACDLSADGRVKRWGNAGIGERGVDDVNARGNAQGEMGDALPFALLP